MKVSPSSKNTLQTPLCIERGWRHFVVGTAASLCVATAVAQSPIAPTDSEPLTREQILAFLKKRRVPLTKLHGNSARFWLVRKTNAVWRKPGCNMTPIGVMPANGLIRAIKSKRFRRVQP